MHPKTLIDNSKLREHLNPDILTKHRFPTIPEVMETDWICETCKKPYIALTLKRRLWTTGNCIPCSFALEKKTLDDERSNRVGGRKEKFKLLCPKIYHEFKRDLLPRADIYDDIISWQMKEKGLLMIGDSRMGKTRCAWQLLKRIYLIEGLNFEAITELHFSHRVSEFGKSETLKDWINKLCNVKVLFIDDLGKAVMTERVAAELFYVFEERMSNHRPIISTMQIDPANYAQKISNRSGKEMADSILNRLKSHCEIIQFN